MLTEKTVCIPKFKHHCDQCVFLGHYADQDLYFCAKFEEQEGTCTVVARRSNDSSDWISGLHIAEVNPWLGEAKRRAIERGLLK